MIIKEIVKYVQIKAPKMDGFVQYEQMLPCHYYGTLRH